MTSRDDVSRRAFRVLAVVALAVPATACRSGREVDYVLVRVEPPSKSARNVIGTSVLCVPGGAPDAAACERLFGSPAGPGTWTLPRIDIDPTWVKLDAPDLVAEDGQTATVFVGATMRVWGLDVAEPQFWPAPGGFTGYLCSVSVAPAGSGGSDLRLRFEQRDHGSVIRVIGPETIRLPAGCCALIATSLPGAAAR